VKPALSLAFCALLAACGGGASTTTTSTAAPAAVPSKPATVSTPSEGAKPAPGSATSAPTALKQVKEPATDGDGENLNDLLKALDDLPTQDDLDAAAAARINEGNADSEYEALKAEIESDLVKPKSDG